MGNYINIMIRKETYQEITRMSVKEGLPKTKIIDECVLERKKRKTISAKEFWEGNDALFKDIPFGKKKLKSTDLKIENAYL